MNIHTSEIFDFVNGAIEAAPEVSIGLGVAFALSSLAVGVKLTSAAHPRAVEIVQE